MKPGVYKLSRDVVNPSADRRQRYDWRAQATWGAGEEFLVEAVWLDRDAPLPPVVKVTISKVDSRYSYQKMSEWGDQLRFAALKDALVTTDESDAAFFAKNEIDSSFARWLVTSGHMSRGQLAVMWTAYAGEE